MSRKGRLINLAISLTLLVIVGRSVSGGFDFLLDHFWFTAGLLMVVLLSLVDQPHFSKDANVFCNGVTGWCSLLLVENTNRDAIWWSFFIAASYLIISSYTLMLIRSRELSQENLITQFISRINRQVGRPEALFSAFFLWGATQQFGSQSVNLNALFLFWAIFMIVNLPAVAQAFDKLVASKEISKDSKAGVLLHVISPRIAEAKLLSELSNGIVGRHVDIITHHHRIAGHAVIIDDRVVAGQRFGKLAITSIGDAWGKIGDDSNGKVTLDLVKEDATKISNQNPISVVDVGSEIGKMVFNVHPNLSLQVGEILWVQKDPQNKAYYQVVSARICQDALSEGNSLQQVKVTAGQLGVWDHRRCRFEPITWVAPAGELVQKSTAISLGEHSVPDGHIIIGKVPNSDFPIHVNIEDAVTHNTAIIGVTGSGKSYLTFHLIESIIANKIKVLILDISRQHFVFLRHLNPTTLKQASEVRQWVHQEESLIGIHQYAVDETGYPATTSDFVKNVFEELSKTKLKAGMNEPARLCVVFEEAHSLIPEWNQVSQPSDNQHVNRTARYLLQGRKYGMGCIIVTQRTANVTKTILNQCNTIFALQSFDQTGLDFLRNYIGDEYAQAISTLPTRNAILVGKASSSARPILHTIDDFSTRWQDKEVKVLPSPTSISTTGIEISEN